MVEDKITYEDIKEYQSLFLRAPSFLLERFARKNRNLALDFKPLVQEFLDNLDETQKHKLDIILKSDIDDLQSIMKESYLRTKKKQFKILADSRYKHFIEVNLNEINKMVKKD